MNATFCRGRRAVAIGLLSVTALILSSCVELIGQRFFVYYHADEDVLEVVIFYDGVHRNRGHHDQQRTEEQIHEFIRDGNVMLLDWWGHIEVGELADAAEETDRSETERRVLQHLAEHLEVETLGHARSGPGQISGVQRVTIAEFSTLVDRLDALIAEGLERYVEKPPRGARRTAQLLAEALEAEYRWLELDGQVLTFNAPLDRREWTMARHEAFDWLIDRLAELIDAPEQFHEAEADLRRGMVTLANLPLHYSDRDGELRISIGHRETANTYPFHIRDADDYNKDLVDTVRDEAPHNVNRELALHKLDAEAHPLRDELKGLAEHGPVDVAIRGLLALVEADDQHASAAAEALDSFAGRWNEAAHSPEAPGARPDAEGEQRRWLRRWQRWLERVEQFPISSAAQ